MEDCDDAVALQEAFIKSIGNVEWLNPEIDFEAELPKGERIPIEDWQEQLIQERIESLRTPGIYLDVSPTGAGKSTADQAALRSAKTGLVVLETHKQCEELEDELSDAGLHAVAYRGRFTVGEGVNCWNGDADDAEKMGLSVAAAVCNYCEYRKECLKEGYLRATEAAREANIAIATHARALHTGLESLAEKRRYLAIHESALDVLLPATRLSPMSLHAAQFMLDKILNDAKWLNSFGEVTVVDSDGHRVTDESKTVRRDRVYQFLIRMADIVDDFITIVTDASITHQCKLPEPCSKPPGIERVLFQISRECKQEVGQLKPWPTLLSIICGRATRISVVVQNVKGNIKKHLSAVRANLPPSDLTTWLADATADAELITNAVGCEVNDRTPDGHLELIRCVEQHAVDVKRSTKNNRVQNLMRGLLAANPRYGRVGIICHRTHEAAIKTLGVPFDHRVCRVAYFGSGEDRALNSWHEECDLLLVVGTPRIPPDVIHAWLVRIGYYDAARRDGKWERLRWIGSTRDGVQRIVEGQGYIDPDWQRVHRAKVRANIVQSVGRGRAYRDSGCDVILLSNEESGFPLCLPEHSVEELTENEVSILRVLIGGPLYSNSIDTSAFISTGQIARKIGLKPRQTRELLNQLEARKLVQRHGERGGWALSIEGAELVPDESGKS